MGESKRKNKLKNNNSVKYIDVFVRYFKYFIEDISRFSIGLLLSVFKFTKIAVFICFGAIPALLFYYLFGLFNSYYFTWKVYDIQPLYLILTSKEVNLAFSLFAILISMSFLYIFYGVTFKKHRAPLWVKLFCIFSSYILVASMFGAFHYIIYYFDNKAYVFDDKIKTEYEERNRNISTQFDKKTKEKNDKLLAVIEYITSNNSGTNPKFLFKNWEERNKSVIHRESVGFCEISSDKLNINLHMVLPEKRYCTMEMTFEKESILTQFISYPGGPIQDDGVIYACSVIEKCTMEVFRAKFRNIINMSINLNNDAARLVLGNTSNGQAAFVTYDLFIWDTILKSVQFRDVSFREFSIFSRGFTLIHSFLMMIFFFLVGSIGSKLFDGIVKNKIFDDHKEKL